MPLPLELKGKTHVVFYYTTDLKKAAQSLAKRLACPCVQVLLGKGNAKGMFGDLPSVADAAWLVAHGLDSDTRLGSLKRGTYVETEDVLDWLVGAGYSIVVDTCCQPDLRRGVGSQYPLSYYCTKDGKDVFQIWQYTDLESWWVGNELALVPYSAPDEDL